MSDTLINANIALALGGLLIVLALVALAIVARVAARVAAPVRSKSTTSSGVVQVLTALTPWLYKAIIAGERAALWGLQQTDSVITGADKAQVAASLYALLPDVIVVDGLPIPVARIKALVPRDTFEEWVKDLYDGTHALIMSNENYLRSQVAALSPAPVPPTSTSPAPTTSAPTTQ